MTLIKDLGYNSKNLPVQININGIMPFSRLSFSVITMYFLQFKVRPFHYELFPTMNYYVLIPTLFLVPIYFLDDLHQRNENDIFSIAFVPFPICKQYVWGNFSWGWNWQGFIPYNAKELISFFLKAKEKYWCLNYNRKGIPATLLFLEKAVSKKEELCQLIIEY